MWQCGYSRRRHAFPGPAVSVRARPAGLCFGAWFSRRGSTEPIWFKPEGAVDREEITSCGSSDGSLAGAGECPAYIPCHLFTAQEQLPAGVPGMPKGMQDGRNSDAKRSTSAALSIPPPLGSHAQAFHGLRTKPLVGDCLQLGRGSKNHQMKQVEVFVVVNCVFV